MTAKNNWITTSLSRRSPQNLCDFTVTINPYPFEDRSFRENSVRVAKELCDLHKKIFVLYSGGLDSEYVASVFLNNKLPFTPLIITTPFNTEEIRRVVDFILRGGGVMPYFLKYGPEFLPRLKEISYAKGYQLSILSILPDICDLVSDMGGCLVLGTGEAANHAPEGDDPFVVFGEYEFFVDHHPGNHVGSFYTYDLALHYSYAKEIDTQADLQTAKHQLYGVPNRPKSYWNVEYYQYSQLHKLGNFQSEVCVPLNLYKTIIEQQLPVTMVSSRDLVRAM